MKIRKIEKARMGGTYAQIYIYLKTRYFLWKQNNKIPSVGGESIPNFSKTLGRNNVLAFFLQFFLSNIVDIER